MAIRKVTKELEAKLLGVVGSRHAKASGKLERKTYGDSSDRLKIQLKGLDQTPDGVALVVVDGIQIAGIYLHNGRGKFDSESRAEGAIPQLQSGQPVEVIIEGEVALQGELVVD